MYRRRCGVQSLAASAIVNLWHGCSTEVKARIYGQNQIQEPDCFAYRQGECDITSCSGQSGSNILYFIEIYTDVGGEVIALIARGTGY